jgi:methionine synthase II (cobalamin-independent)
MVAQFSQNLPCLELDSRGLHFNPQDKEEKLEAFYEKLLADDLDYFGLSEEYAVGFHAFCRYLRKHDLKRIVAIKAHITGPFTFAASLKDEQGRVLLHDPVFRQVIVKGLSMKARWQIKKLSEFGKEVILFVDEPFLGCFGSAYTPINREDVVRGLSEFAQELNPEPAILGVHCCGNTDWSIFTDIPEMGIINFDAFSFLEKVVLYAEDLDKFIKRGGVLCWGVVPTEDSGNKEAPSALIDKINTGVDILIKKGLSRDLLFDNLLISPACGLGMLEPPRAQKILGLLSEVSLYLRR